MLEIWGRPYSSNVIPVIWTVNELALDYTLQLAGGSFGKLETAEYAEINPNRMIPAVRDGTFALWESHAIVRYLSHQYSSGELCPVCPQTRAIADQWMDWSASRAFPPVIQLFLPLSARLRRKEMRQEFHRFVSRPAKFLVCWIRTLPNSNMWLERNSPWGIFLWAALPTGISTLVWNARACRTSKRGISGSASGQLIKNT